MPLLAFWRAPLEARTVLRRVQSLWSAAFVNFDLSEDDEMLKALAERFVADRYDPDQRRAGRAEEHGFSSENWAFLGELGLIAAQFSESDGGLGVDQVGQATVFEALGRGLVAEPLIESAAIAGGLFAALAPAALKADWMAGLVSGAKRIALAHREQAARHNLAFVETKARRNGQGIILSGTKSLVPAGEGVDGYIVSARVSGEETDRDGVSLYLVDAKSPGLTVRPWRLVDGSVAVALTLRDVVVPEDHCLGGDIAAVEAALERGTFLHCAEALGIMEKLFADTQDYLRTRTQFGATLGSFQALQHRMVAQYAAIEQARALLDLATMATTPAARSRAINGARAFIADASITLGHEMIQMHGGMGVTDELSIGHGHKRLLFLSRWPEDASASLDRYAAS
jgi:alkylation response protein AidB-like acyl-CoA dehydrogenase